VLIKVCPKCSATWIDDQLYWSTGKMGCPHDLAGLSCNLVNSPDCINPCKGSTSGVTWQHYQAQLDRYNENGTYKDDD